MAKKPLSARIEGAARDGSGDLTAADIAYLVNLVDLDRQQAQVHLQDSSGADRRHVGAEIAAMTLVIERLEILPALLAKLRELLKSALQDQVTGFYGDATPTFRQGPPSHELEQIVTADSMGYLIQKILDYKRAVEPK